MYMRLMHMYICTSKKVLKYRKQKKIKTKGMIKSDYMSGTHVCKS